MKQTDTTPLFATPFGAQADSTTITTIPQDKPAIGRASLALGFPKETFTPLAAGGVPPYGEDMNGILNMLSRAARAAELGMLHPFSASHAAAIGGYPAGATIAHPTIAGRFLICTMDNNSNDPAQGMTGWADPLAGFVTGYGHSTGDRNPTNLWGNSQGGVSVNFSDGSEVDLANSTDLTAETNRAKQAEAGLLPLAGGTVSGTINRAGGGVLPEVLGLSGRVVIQVFTVVVPQSPQVWANRATFPQAFKPGTVPHVFLQINAEEGSPSDGTVTRTAVLTNNSENNAPEVDNTGFSYQAAYLSPGGLGNTQWPWHMNVMAIGVTQ